MLSDKNKKYGRLVKKRKVGKMQHSMKKVLLLITASSMLTACGAGERLANVGKAPDMTQISNPANEPTANAVSMPMPAASNVQKQANSLWSSDKKGFFKDQRASDVGDILTVIINIDDKAELENETERRRTSTEDADMNSLLGIEASLAEVFPEAINNADLINLGSTSLSRGEGTVDREEEVDLKLAAVVTQLLPNGNMVIVGRQEVRVNFEKRVLEFAGVIRPEDITIQNTIPYEKVAEARISYGGKGQISDVQQPRYGQQVYDIIFPF